MARNTNLKWIFAFAAPADYSAVINKSSLLISCGCSFHWGCDKRSRYCKGFQWLAVWLALSNDTTYMKAHKIFIFATKEWSRRDKKLCGENFKYIFRYISSAKHIKLFFIIKVNTFWGESGEISMHAISGAKRMMEISMQIYIKILYRDDDGDGEGIRYTTTTKNTIHMNGGEW